MTAGEEGTFHIISGKKKSCIETGREAALCISEANKWAKGIMDRGSN